MIRLARLFRSSGVNSSVDEMLVELCQRELMVYEIVQLMGLERSPLSQHLKRLRDANLVTCRKKGKNTLYSAVPGLTEKLVLFTLRSFTTDS